MLDGAVPDRNADGKPDVGPNDLPDFDRLYEGFYEEALQKISPAGRRKARRLIEKGLIFEWDNQRINLHERMIRHNYGVDAALIQQLTDLRLLRAEPSTLGGNNIELSHDAFVQPILNAARRRRQNRWRNLALAALGLAAGCFLLLAIWFSFSKPMPDDRVVRKNIELSNRLDSLEQIRLQEEQARAVVLRYVDCVNNHDIECLSGIMCDTLERYYLVENFPRARREKLERDYFRRHSGEKIKKVEEVTVTKSGNKYEATLDAIFLYQKKGSTPVVFQIKLDSTFRMFYLRSFIATD